MTIFTSEPELLAILAKIETALESAAHSGPSAFRSHYLEAAHLYNFYAIDGHESDSEERELLSKHAKRITRIENALSSAEGLCSEEDAEKEIYQIADRYGADEAARRLRLALENE